MLGDVRGTAQVKPRRTTRPGTQERGGRREKEGEGLSPTRAGTAPSYARWVHSSWAINVTTVLTCISLKNPTRDNQNACATERKASVRGGQGPRGVCRPTRAEPLSARGENAPRTRRRRQEKATGLRVSRTAACLGRSRRRVGRGVLAAQGGLATEGRTQGRAHAGPRLPLDSEPTAPDVWGAARAGGAEQCEGTWAPAELAGTSLTPPTGQPNAEGGPTCSFLPSRPPPCGI